MRTKTMTTMVTNEQQRDGDGGAAGDDACTESSLAASYFRIFGCCFLRGWGDFGAISRSNER